MDRRTPTTGPAVGPRGETLLNDIEYRFRLMGQGPSPLSVDGRSLGHGLPRRAIALPELSAILMHPSCGYAARDAAWRLLVGRARTGDPAWRAGAVGVALPGLRFKAYLLAKLFTGDVQAAIVEHFLRALATVDVAKPGVVGNLLSAAFSKARTELRDLEPASSGAPNHAPSSVVPPAPFGHPDLVLARAVTAEVITAQEAELIGATYLEEVSLTVYAERTGQPRWNLYKRRTAAVARLRAAIESGALSDPYADVVNEATATVVLDGPAAWKRRD
ncbi:hypothetical protein ACFFMR_11840 [Micromonospora andamanensis]|uniref:Uncharacterized protein n=1 Tax=Micromonospora andamanensis TaxID=1287068 RepID=A0ABQ4HP29_9ACTN|nr:hypothetical protein [Micromonospora andamanensis]GIJ07281.1 hypothetical protein Van01_04950 [Micromonospora andamanensis]